MSQLEKRKVVVALAGNPNSGKTTIFNNLTRANQHVGNYPGVTVEKITGTCKLEGVELQIVDLPGTYSLTAQSPEELVARNFIIQEKPDVVVNVLDASNLERHLYLTTQLMELGVPLILVLNMRDEARKQGIEFNLETLSELLGAPLVQTVGHKNQGTEDLLETIKEVAGCGPGEKHVQIHYGPDVEAELAKIEKIWRETFPANTTTPPRWGAVKLLERDQEIAQQVKPGALANRVAKSRERLEKLLGEDMEIIIADQRHGFVSGACQEAVRNTVETRRSRSDQVDAVLTHPMLGFPVFILLMFLVFQFTFTLGNPVMGWIEALFGWLGGWINGWWPTGTLDPLRSLIVDGIIGGVGGVIVFLPNIIFLFLAISLLEDTGYMARGAFIMDRWMHKIGLHGKSFIPMLLGFGCSVPAIMATRTLENERDRLTTMLVIPLISCGARLPIYTLIAPAFFPLAWQAPMVLLIYLTGVVMAVIAARFLRRTLFKGESTPFVMELPPYRMPTVMSLLLHTWHRAWHYLKKAGTLILGISIILWALTSYPQKPQEQPVSAGETVRLTVSADQVAGDLAYSFAGRIGRVLSVPLSLVGFDWKIATALIGAFAAKEVFVAQLGIVYAVESASDENRTLRDQLRRNYSPLVGFCIMLFSLISLPCLATLAVVRQESGSWKWPLYQAVGLTVLAYTVTLVVYQVGRTLGIGV